MVIPNFASVRFHPRPSRWVKIDLFNGLLGALEVPVAATNLTH